MKLDEFTQAYIKCALWASTDEDGTPLDKDYNIGDIAFSTEAEMVEDCRSFQDTNADLLAQWYDSCGENPARAGHDFWLTRNGHGAGFWDRWSGDTPQGEIGKDLTKAAKAYGSCDLYVGDDAHIYA